MVELYIWITQRNLREPETDTSFDRWGKQCPKMVDGKAESRAQGDRSLNQLTSQSGVPCGHESGLGTSGICLGHLVEYLPLFPNDRPSLWLLLPGLQVSCLSVGHFNSLYGFSSMWMKHYCSVYGFLCSSVLSCIRQTYSWCYCVPGTASYTVRFQDEADIRPASRSSLHSRRNTQEAGDRNTVWQGWRINQVLWEVFCCLHQPLFVSLADLFFNFFFFLKKE